MEIPLTQFPISYLTFLSQNLCTFVCSFGGLCRFCPADFSNILLSLASNRATFRETTTAKRYTEPSLSTSIYGFLIWLPVSLPELTMYYFEMYGHFHLFEFVFALLQPSP